MSDNKDKKPAMSIKKFGVLGVAAVLTMYAAQAVTVVSYNNVTQHNHDSKMVGLYTDIWKNIDKVDVSDKIQTYKELANNVPKELKIGIILPEKTEIPLAINDKLPSADVVEVAARNLNDKTKIKFTK